MGESMKKKCHYLYLHRDGFLPVNPFVGVTESKEGKLDIPEDDRLRTDSLEM